MSPELEKLINKLESLKDLSFTDKVSLANRLIQLDNSQLKLDKALLDTAYILFSGTTIKKEQVNTFVLLVDEAKRWVIDFDNISTMQAGSYLKTLTKAKLSKAPKTDEIAKAKAVFYVE